MNIISNSILKLFGVEVGDYLIFKKSLEVKKVEETKFVKIYKADSLEEAKAWCEKNFHVINEEGQFEW